MINNERIKGIFPETAYKLKQEKIEKAYDELYAGTGSGKEMTGWLFWPREYLVSSEYERLKVTAEKIRKENKAVVIIGIGGSYLTPKMILSSEYGPEYNLFASKLGLPKVCFAGCDLSPDRLQMISQILSEGDWSIIYVSKSGGTMEPALAFRYFWEKLQKRYKDAANGRVYAVTDPKDGILKTLANKHGWESFEIPKNIGGRFSGLTACGLLPCAVAGLNTDELLKGAICAMREESNCYSFAANYAKWRFSNYKEDRMVEFFANNDPDFAYAGEWLKQLFGESEGKDNKGIFPTSGVFPTDLHSLGQFLQEGTRGLIFETFFERKFKNSIDIPKVELQDNLKAREGKSFEQAARAAMDGAYKAHSNGGNPTAVVRMDSGLEAMGYFMQSMFIACGVYCYLLQVNPFNQPGVEQHKIAMRTSTAWAET